MSLNPMQLLSSMVEDESKIVTVKNVAYALNIPLKAAIELTEEYACKNKEAVTATWAVIGTDKVTLVDQDGLQEVEALLGEQFVSKSLYALEKRREKNKSDIQALNASVDEVRKKLIVDDPSDRLISNQLGEVELVSLALQAPASGPMFKAPDAVDEAAASSTGTSRTAGKTAADFFRNSSITSQRSDTSKGTAATVAKPGVISKVNGAQKGGFFDSFKGSSNKPKNETEKEPEQEQASSASTASPARKTVDQASVTTADVQQKHELDEEDDESSMSSSEGSLSSESEQEDAEDDGERGSAQHVAAKPSSSVSKKQRKRASLSVHEDGGEVKKKTRRVISDDDDDSPEALAKAAARRERQEKRRAEREAERLAEKEAKHRREVEEKEGAKHDFLKQMGATAVDHNTHVVKKKVLKTRTFLDEDGFEVTEDVMEEVELVVDDGEEENKGDFQPKQHQPSQKPISSKDVSEAKPSATTSSKSTKAASSGKQASLTSFFSKKAKE